jgi:hypothetical protein
LPSFLAKTCVLKITQFFRKKTQVLLKKSCRFNLVLEKMCHKYSFLHSISMEGLKLQLANIMSSVAMRIASCTADIASPLMREEKTPRLHALRRSEMKYHPHRGCKQNKINRAALAAHKSRRPTAAAQFTDK